MICVNLKSFTRQCGSVSGGLSDLLVFDPSDFNFTNEANGAYTAVARRAGATAEGGAMMFPIKFQENEANRTWKHTRTGCSVTYDMEIRAQLPQLSQETTEFLQSLDAAGCCCGLGLAIRHNDGKIFIAGEKYVNNASITKFSVVMDGSDGDSGKTLQEFNGANVLFKASYSRDLREFTGSWAVLEAFTDGALVLSIATQPVGNSYAAGGTINLSVAPTGGTLPYTFQWQKSVDNGATFTNISGATNSTYSKAGATSPDSGQYRAVVSHAGGGTATSNPAVVTVAA